MRTLALTLAVLALTACGPVRPDPPVVPKIVRVTVEKIVPVPASLTAPCEVYQVKAQTYGQAVEAANKRKASLEACNVRMAEIRALGQKP